MPFWPSPHPGWIAACLLSMLVPVLPDGASGMDLAPLIALIVLVGLGASTAYLIPWSLLDATRRPALRAGQGPGLRPADCRALLWLGPHHRGGPQGGGHQHHRLGGDDPGDGGPTRRFTMYWTFVDLTDRVF